MKVLTPVTLALLLLSFSAQSQTSYFEITKRSAEEGDVVSQYNLGQMYAYGESIPEDDAEAVKWFRLAAEQGFARAQFNLGVMYAQGEGIPKDYLAAYVWLSTAASQGHDMAGKYKDKVAGVLNSAQIARGKEMTTHCIESGYKDCN